MTDQTMTLKDGRTLGYVELGDASGQPAFFFHGTPGSRLCLDENDAIMRIAGVRWVLPDRPGYGLSSPKPERTLLDWASDVAELADRLGFERFVSAGASGGGPHALACAYALPQRVTKTLITCCPTPANFKGATDGMAFGNRLGLFFGRYFPWLQRKSMGGYVKAFHKNPDGFILSMSKQMAKPDRELIKQPPVLEAIVRDFREAFRQGGEAQAVDGVLAMTSRQWDFKLSGIKGPVHLWHGEVDSLVTRAMAERLASEIPRCEMTLVPGAGHLLTEVPSVVEEVARELRA